MFTRARAGFEHWQQRLINRRIQPQTLPFTLPGSRLYVLPTRGGLYFAVLVTVMLAGSLNYANSLGFVVTFLLAGIGLVSMHHTQRNLLHLGVRAIQAGPVFAGNTAHFILTLANPTRLPRHAIYVAAADTDANEDVVSVAAGTDTTADIGCPAPRRGRMPCPRLRLDSRYPLGLFHSWGWLSLRATVVVYPRPEGDLPLPRHGSGGRDATQSRASGDTEFSGHRRYAPGDSPRRIDWKASARTDALVVTQRTALRDDTLWLDINALAHLPLESRLSQLARWVVDADSAGLRYGVRLAGNGNIAPDTGPRHKHACLKALALYP